jgi:hypothetical protein
MDMQHFLLAIEDKVATVTISRPDKGTFLSRVVDMKQKQKSAKFLCGIDKE